MVCIKCGREFEQTAAQQKAVIRTCGVCRSEVGRQWRQRHPERARQHCREYYRRRCNQVRKQGA